MAPRVMIGDAFITPGMDSFHPPKPLEADWRIRVSTT